MGEPELRWDVLEEEWRIIPAARQDRPNLPAADCPFCPGGLEAPEPYTVRVFPNRWPPLVPGPRPVLDPVAGTSPARGAAEIILYSPAHDARLADADLAAVVGAWRDRTAGLSARDEVAYVLCFENRGAEVGATISHPHGQIYGFPFVPPRPARLFRGPAEGCRVCADLAAAPLRLGPDDRPAVLWVPRASAWPYAFRLAPIRHVGSLAELSPVEEAGWRDQLRDGLRALDALWQAPMPYMLDLHQCPCDGGDWPAAHLLLEVAAPVRSPGVMRYVAAGEVGSGTYQNPVSPESAHAALADAWP